MTPEREKEIRELNKKERKFYQESNQDPCQEIMDIQDLIAEVDRLREVLKQIQAQGEAAYKAGTVDMERFSLKVIMALVSHALSGDNKRPSKERLEEIRKQCLWKPELNEMRELFSEIDALQEENQLSEKCWNGAEDDLNSWVDRCNSLEADRDAAIKGHLAMEMQIKEVINERDHLKAALKACLGNEYFELIRERDELKRRLDALERGEK